MMRRSSCSRSNSIRVGSSRTVHHEKSRCQTSFNANPLWIKQGNRRTAQVVVTLRPRRTERVRVLREPVPFLWVILPRLVWCQSIPDSGVDFGHLRFLDNFDIEGSIGRRMTFCTVCGSEEWPGGVMGTTTGRGPDLGRSWQRLDWRIVGREKVSNNLLRDDYL